MHLRPYLTDDEIEEITEPLTQGAARRKFFQKLLGIEIDKKPNGQPLVWRSDWEAGKRVRNAAASGAANDEQRSNGANFDALTNRVQYVRGTPKKRQSAGA